LVAESGDSCVHLLGGGKKRVAADKAIGYLAFEVSHDVGVADHATTANGKAWEFTHFEQPVKGWPGDITEFVTGGVDAVGEWGGSFGDSAHQTLLGSSV
jgi:hypothetical protein